MASMNAEDQVHPGYDTWAIAVHAGEDDEDDPLGTGVVIDERRVLTCAHVAEAVSEIWVSFPKVAGGNSDQRLPVERVVWPARRARVKDLAVLYLSRPVPAGVSPAPLRCPKPGDLVPKRWWAFGFPDQDPLGNSADGRVGATLAHGWIRLDTSSRYEVQQGFSGGGLWSPDYQAVVGVVGQASSQNGDGRAVTLHQADQWFPDEHLWALSERWSAPEAGEMAMAAWGWSLASDHEGTRHWRPRARGVSRDSERGYRFRGRTAALRVIRDWLDRREPDQRALVITGAPGTGKSAVLGRIVTTADRDAASLLPGSDTAMRADIGSVGCAVHAKGKSALEVAREIARAASAALPEQIEDFPSALHDALEGRARRFNVIIDALDEAVSPEQARLIIGAVILPTAWTCADVGAQMIVGSRRADSEGALLDAFDGQARLVDLDDAEFFADEDLAAYALATLRLAGDERPGNPYDDDEATRLVADRIAALSGRNFLVAGLTARMHGLHDEAAADPVELSFSASVDDAMHEYLRCIPPVPTGVSAEAPSISALTLLTALAFAESPGLPAVLWRAALRALGVPDITEEALARFARSSAASFLVESAGDDEQGTTFRLFHQALNEALLSSRAEVAEPARDERALTLRFLEAGRESGWSRAPGYLLRSLPLHAARAGLVDDLLSDQAYLLHADVRRVLRAASLAGSRSARTRLLGLTPWAPAAGPDERAAMFGVTEALAGLGTDYQEDPRSVPYRAQWAAATARQESLALHDPGGGATAVCTVRIGDRSLVATGSRDGKIRLWDPADGALIRDLEGHADWATAVCGVNVAGRSLLAAGSLDGAVRLWDPATGTLIRALEGHGEVDAVCEVEAGALTLLASGRADGTVRLWDPYTGTLIRTLEGHTGGVRAVCELDAGSGVLLATGSRDGTVRLWNPADGTHIRTLEGHTDEVEAACAVRDGDRILLATGSIDGTARLWDPATGTPVRTLRAGAGGLYSLCAVQAESRLLLAGGGADGTVRLWDPATGTLIRTLEGHTEWVYGLCAVEAGYQSLLAAGSIDGTVRLWDLQAAPAADDGQPAPGWVRAACAVKTSDRTLLATGGTDGKARLWEPATGTPVHTLEGHTGPVEAVCPVQAEGRALLATGSLDGTARLWDPATGTLIHMLPTQNTEVRAICTVKTRGRTLLATGGGDGTASLWDPATGTLIRTLQAHVSGVNAVCAVRAGGRTLLATGSGDGSTRLWHPTRGTLVRILRARAGGVFGLCAVAETGDRTLLAAGSGDGTIRLWDSATGAPVRTLEGHAGPVDAVCPVQAGNRDLLASGSVDGTIRLWDPATGSLMLSVPAHHAASAITSVADSLAVGLEAGVLVIKFDATLLA